MATDLQSRYIYSIRNFSCPSSEFQAELRKYSGIGMLRRYVPLPGNVLPFWPDLVQSTHNSKERLYEPPKNLCPGVHLREHCRSTAIFPQDAMHRPKGLAHTLWERSYHSVSRIFIGSFNTTRSSFRQVLFITAIPFFILSNFYAFAIHVQFRSRTPFRDAQVKGKTNRISV